MAQKLDGGLPQNMDLGGGYTLRFAALDPTTGAAATGVNISAAFILASNILAIPVEQLAVGPFMLVPGPNA